MARYIPGIIFFGWLALLAMGPFAVTKIAVLVKNDVLHTILAPFFLFWFFVPQYIFPMTTFHSTGRIWPGVWVLLWAFIGLVFSWFARNFRPERAFWTAGLTILFGTMALHIVFMGAGFMFHPRGL